MPFVFAEDEIKNGGGNNGGGTIKSPINRNRNGSTAEMAVDQLQASEKLIAGKLESHLTLIVQLEI